MGKPLTEIERAAGMEALSEFGYLNTLSVLCQDDLTKSGYYLSMEWGSYNTILWRMKEKAEYEEMRIKIERTNKKLNNGNT